MTIQFKSDGPIGVLTLNRPERLNAIDFTMADALRAFLHERLNDFDLRVIVLTGAGKGFCSGLDMKDPAIIGDVGRYEPHLAYRLQKSYSDLILMMRRIPQPIIAAINGPAAGAGLALALASDVRLAVPTAKISAAFINIGVGGADLGSSWLLTRLVGLGNAARYMYTGEVFTGEEAYRIGLVQKLCPPETILDDAMQMARTLAAKSPFGLRLTKEALDMNAGAASLEQAIRLEDRNQSLCIAQLGLMAAKAKG